jgi:hypothetical protein
MNRLRASLSTFARLPVQQQRAFLAALMLIPASAIALRLAGFGRLHRWAAHAAPSNNAQLTGRQCAQAVSRAARHGLWHGNCLSQSLVLLRLLRRQGQPGQLRIGARNSGGRLEAHAWVESDGTVLNDAPDVVERFPPFPALDRIPDANFV